MVGLVGLAALGDLVLADHDPIGVGDRGQRTHLGFPAVLACCPGPVPPAQAQLDDADCTGGQPRTDATGNLGRAAVVCSVAGAKVGVIDPSRSGRYKVLYHGSRNFKGTRFSLQLATADIRSTTRVPGIYLTDDFNRAASGYRRGGVVVRVVVPEEFANSILQLGGPNKKQPEFFVNTQESVDILNQGITDMLDTPDATRRYFAGNF